MDDARSIKYSQLMVSIDCECQDISATTLIALLKHDFIRGQFHDSLDDLDALLSRPNQGSSR